MIPTDTTTGQPYTPIWLEGQDNAAKYYLRGASVLERAQIEAELGGEYGARRIYGFEIFDALRDGVTALLDEGEGRDRLLELASVRHEGGEMTLADRQLLGEAEAILAKHWPEYRELMATQARRTEVAPIIVFARLCTGWDNVDVKFERGKDGRISEAALAALDPLEVKAAGNFGYGMLYDAGPKRNFPQPSPSADSPKPTPSGRVSKGAGKSTAKSGKRTRGSRSPRGSGPSSKSG